MLIIILAIAARKMCGIAGYMTLDGDPRLQQPDVVARMTSAIAHRGPDDSGYWRDQEVGVGLGMRRLAIIDLSPAGAQPMLSECGRFVLVFNGEIYNHKEIRAALESEGRAPHWRGHSDTEVLLAGIATWGLVRSLQAANGMFALALWDRNERTLQLACDRFGEKPLYFGWMGNTFLFASELKAMSQHPAWAGEVDRTALGLLLRYCYIPAPHSIFRGVQKLRPGTIAELRRDRSHRTRESSCRPYWSTHEMVARSIRQPLKLDLREAVGEFERLMRDAVKLRMESDVPLGAFLSGGFDSTAVVALMQAQSLRPVRTFTIGFTERGYNEAPYAKNVALHLRTDHTELYVSPEQAMEVIPKLPALYDEPFADSSQIPTFLVAQLARNHVTVALSGDAGDELFGGYNRYFVSDRLLPTITAMPHSVRQLAARAINCVGAQGWDRLYQALSLGRGQQLVGDRALKLADLLAAPTLLEGYRYLVSSWPAPSAVLIDGAASMAPVDEESRVPGGMTFTEQMMYLDLVTYLPGDILTKVDRATMGVSLEGRMPFLDHRIAEFAWQLPLAMKVRDGIGKRIVREMVYRHVPKEIIDRPKTGFGIPVGDWLRGPLREWAESLIGPHPLTDSGYFNPAAVGACWTQHVSGHRNWQARLWPILMFQAWHKQINNGDPRTK